MTTLPLECSSPRLFNALLPADNVHYTTEGWEYLAGNMTAGLRRALGGL